MAGPDQVGWQTDLQAQALRLGVADRITWCGMLTGDLKWAAYRAAEVFVLPSHQENFGVAVAEALAMGLPVLVSDQVNIWREIARDEAGLVAPDTRAGTVQLLRSWLGMSFEQRHSMAARAGRCFESHFQMQSAARRLHETMAPHVQRR
jgi:glycosyltransferase involved in cell wall biosynthesis